MVLLLSTVAASCSAPGSDEGAVSGPGDPTVTDVQDAATLASDLAGRFPDEAERIDHIAERAAEAGSVTLYTALNLAIIEPWVEAFEQRYPQVEVEFVRLNSVPLVERLRSEAQAGRSETDVVVTPGLPLAELWEDGLIAEHHGAPVPEDLPERFVGDWAVTTYLTPEVVAWNTDRRTVAEPITWDQLARGDLEGCAIFPQADGIIAAVLADRGEEAAGEWLDDFVATGAEPHETRSSVPPALASGELDCTADTFVHWVEDLRTEGAPVDWQALDPTPTTTSSVALHANAARPYAALLLMHWLLGEEAAQVVADSGRIPARPGLELDTSELERFVDPDDALAESSLLLTPEFMSESEATIRQLREDHLGPLSGGRAG